MSKGNTFENDLLLLIFNATTIANIAINATSSPLTDLYVALHTADPGEAGTATTSEATFGAYARVAVPRTNVGWTVSTDTVTNAAAVTFPACTSGSNTITYFSVTTAISGATKILYSGAIATPAAGLVVSTGVTASFAIGGITCTET